jgi:hypothetical protein
MTTMRRSLLLGGIILLGFALRFFQINVVSLRGDEAFTVLHWMREPLASTLADIATKDPQALLSYAVYRGWALVMGTSEYVARLLPALFSVIGIPVMYALGHRLCGRKLGLLAAFLWAISPFQIYHAQDARSYAIWSVLSLAAVWLALRALDRQRRIDWLLYVVAAALAGYIYYLELFVVVALNLYVLIRYWRNRSLLARWFAAEIVVGMLLAPWYLQPRLLTGSGYGGTGGSFDPAQWLTRFIPTLTFGNNAAMFANAYEVLVVALLIALLVSLVLWWRRNRSQTLLLASWGTVPLLLLGIVSLRLSVFEPRYVLAAAPVYTLLLAALALHFRQRLVRWILIALPVFVSLFILYNYYFIADYAKAPNWRTLAAYLQTQVAPTDWVTQAGADIAFMLYCEDYQLVEVCNDQLPANPIQSQEEIEGNLVVDRQQNTSIWYIDRPQNWANANIAQDWLDSNMQRVRETAAGGLRIQQFKRWDTDAEEISAEPLAAFEGAVQLVSARTFIDPTDQLTVWLYWRALAQSDTPLKIFLHLTTPDGIAAQDDQYPQDGRIDATTWEIGTIYRDVYTLALSGVEAGDYSLIVGFYDPETNRRLPVDEDGGDSFTIQMITLPG